MTVRAALCGLVLLAGCAAAPSVPLTLPAADGRTSEVRLEDGFVYVVGYQAMAQASGGVSLRVTRASAPELTYSDGLPAKQAAQAFCAGFNRALAPNSFGRFSVPASWLFDGGCR